MSDARAPWDERWEERKAYYKLCSESHTWDGPTVYVGSDVSTCSVCGADESMYDYMCHSESKDAS